MIVFRSSGFLIGLLVLGWTQGYSSEGQEIKFFRECRTSDGNTVPGASTFYASHLDAFALDLHAIFNAVREISGQNGALEWDPGHGEWCDRFPVGLGALDAGLRVRSIDTIYACSRFAAYVNNREELFFAMAHEFAHLRNKDGENRIALRDSLVRQWEQDHQESISKENLEEAKTEICPKLIESYRNQEFMADSMAADLTQQARLDPKAGARIQERIRQAYRSAGMAEPTDAAPSRAERISRLLIREGIPEEGP